MTNICSLIDNCPDELRESNLDSAPLFSLCGMLTPARIFRVYDGDSAYMTIVLHGKCTSFKVRIANIDTAEIRTANDIEKRLAIEARDRLRELIDNKVCVVKCYEFDKYGRCLVDLYTYDGQNVADILLEECLAYRYDGNKKENDWNRLYFQRMLLLDELVL